MKPPWYGTTARLREARPSMIAALEALDRAAARGVAISGLKRKDLAREVNMDPSGLHNALSRMDDDAYQLSRIIVDEFGGEWPADARALADGAGMTPERLELTLRLLAHLDPGRIDRGIASFRRNREEVARWQEDRRASWNAR